MKNYDNDLKQSLIRMASIISYRIKPTSYIKPKISEQEFKKLNLNRNNKDNSKSLYRQKIYKD